MENKEDVPLLQEEPVSTGEKAQETEQADVNEPQAVIGFPVEHIRESVRRGDHILSPGQPWSTTFFECFGSDDEFCKADLKICLLGTCCPCVLYGQNMEQLNPGQTSFFFGCCVYTSICIGSAAVCQIVDPNLSSCNAVSLYTFPGRTALRKAHNLTGYGDCILDHYNLCCLTKSKGNQEDCDSFCDFALHCCCHRCALCQEGREIHRRTAQSEQASLRHKSAPSMQTMEWVHCMARSDIDIETKAI